MFESLTKHLQSIFSALQGKSVLTEENIAEAMGQVRTAFLEADVNYSVAEDFIRRVRDRVQGKSLLKKVSPGQQFISLVHEELVSFMGGEEMQLDMSRKPSVIMLCGLQGAGKTTSAAKLALHLSKNRRKVLLAACDLQRPAAVEQLQKLGDSIQIPVVSPLEEKDPLKWARHAYERALRETFDVLIVDTAGRLHLDADLMQELEEMKKILSPQEILFVASALMGQDAVRAAREFDLRLQMSGTILTMLDGNARAGAAISIREVTKKPLKFEGVGEKIGDFQVFNPRSMADRILGMGDVINLMKKAQEHADADAEKELKKKIRTASFTYEDYLEQISKIRKMGPLTGLLKMIPGMGALGDLPLLEKDFNQFQAIICSMTPRERREEEELTVSHKKRIAAGSGTLVDDVNRMVKGFKRLKSMFKDMPSLSKMKGIPSMHDLQNISRKMGSPGKWPRHMR